MKEGIIIKSILVVPYSKLICLYYINDGDRHATTYEKVVSLLMELVPTLVYEINKKMERRLPFFVDTQKKVLSEVESSHELIHIKNTQMEIAEMKKKESMKPKFSNNIEQLISKVIKRRS
jgi:hypothetical protein